METTTPKLDVRKEIERHKSNYNRILDYLREHGEATNIQLQRIGGIRWHGRVGELRKDGYLIPPPQLTNRPGVRVYYYKGHKDDKQQAKTKSRWNRNFLFGQRRHAEK